MLRAKSLFALIAVFTSAFLLSSLSRAEFFPGGGVPVPVDNFNQTGITRAEYDKAINRVVEVYRPIILRNRWRFVVNKLWDDPTANALASFRQGVRSISMFGGLARYQHMTPDGFAMVTCHELGHHIGSAPRKPDSIFSNEGQSDYYAALKCFRRLYESEDNSDWALNAALPRRVVETCTRQFGDVQRTGLCVRTVMAGMSLALVLRQIRLDRKWWMPIVDFFKQSSDTVNATNHSHPQPQCRLDTYIAGALCRVPHSNSMSTYNEEMGTCGGVGAVWAGTRPGCWYKPVSAAPPPRRSIWGRDSNGSEEHSEDTLEDGEEWSGGNHAGHAHGELVLADELGSYDLSY